MQHPDREHRILHLAAPDMDILLLRNAGRITGYTAAQRTLAAGLAACIGTGRAIIDAHIVFISQKTGQIRIGKGLEFLVIKRLNGIHVFIRHFA